MLWAVCQQTGGTKMQSGTNWWGDQQLASFRLKLGFVISCLIQPWQCRPLEGYHYQSRCTRGAIPLVEPAWLIIVGNNRPVMRLITADEAALRQRGQLPADKGRPSQPLTIQYKSQQGEATPTDIPIKRLSGLFLCNLALALCSDFGAQGRAISASLHPIIGVRCRLSSSD